MSAIDQFTRSGAALRHLAAVGLTAGLLVGAAILPAGAAAQSVDSDGDGISDAGEIGLSLKMYDKDTDDDGLEDGQELYDIGTHPNSFDTDDDHFTDGQEVNMYGTNPLLPDTDGDGLTEYDEYVAGTDPLVPNSPPAGPDPVEPAPGERPDRDGDGLYDDDETDVYGTDPDGFDTDEDGSGDGEEVYNGTDPLS